MSRLGFPPWAQNLRTEINISEFCYHYPCQKHIQTMQKCQRLSPCRVNTLERFHVSFKMRNFYIIYLQVWKVQTHSIIHGYSLCQYWGIRARESKTSRISSLIILSSVTALPVPFPLSLSPSPHPFFSLIPLTFSSLLFPPCHSWQEC